VRHLAFVDMSNVLNEAKKQQVIALGRLGWPLRRIEQETGVRRETAGAYLKAAGIGVRPAGAWADLYRRLGGFRRRVLPIRRRLHCSRLAKIVRNRSAAFSPGGFRNWNKTILKEKSRKSSPLLSIFSTCHD
jgi:hypothetical protein